MEAVLAPLATLPRDIRKAASTLTVPQARVLVDLFYALQKFRIEAGNQKYALTKSEEPSETVGFFHGQMHMLEKGPGYLQQLTAARYLGS